MSEQMNAPVALGAIAALHRQGKVAGGGTSGYCAECQWQWPCRTVHLANGWGDSYDCEEAGWCSHAQVKLTPPDEVGPLDLEEG